MYSEIRDQFKVPEMLISEFKKTSNTVLVDVRSSNERKISILPGAISQSQYEKTKSQMRDMKVVVYCTIGYRSAQYVQELRKQDIKAYNLEGSLLGWAHIEQKLLKPDGTGSKKIHVYGKKWNLPPKGYETVW